MAIFRQVSWNLTRGNRGDLEGLVAAVPPFVSGVVGEAIGEGDDISAHGVGAL